MPTKKAEAAVKTKRSTLSHVLFLEKKELFFLILNSLFSVSLSMDQRRRHLVKNKSDSMI